MLIDKFYICGPRAVRWVCDRFQIPLLSPTDMAVLYALKRMERASIPAMLSYMNSYGSTVGRSSLAQALPRLIGCGLVSKDRFVYSLSPEGRFFLSRIRNYLLRIRL